MPATFFPCSVSTWIAFGSATTGWSNWSTTCRGETLNRCLNDGDSWRSAACANAAAGKRERGEDDEGKRAPHRCCTPAYCEKWPKIAAESRSEKSMTAVVTKTVAKPVAAAIERGRNACAIGKIEPTIIVQPSA